MQIRYLNVTLLFFLLTMPIRAQQRAIINNAKSPHSALRSVDLADVKLTGGFWAENRPGGGEDTGSRVGGDGH